MHHEKYSVNEKYIKVCIFISQYFIFSYKLVLPRGLSLSPSFSQYDQTRAG